MKKTLALLLALLLALSLCACGDDGFQAQYDELADELKEYSDRCDYTAQVAVAGWQSFRTRFPSSSEDSVRDLVARGIKMAMQLGQCKDISEVISKNDLTEKSAYLGLVLTAQLVNPDNWEGTDKYGEYSAGTWNQDAEDETMEICQEMYTTLEYADSDIANRVTAFCEEHSEKHEEECERLANLCGTVGSYILFTISPEDCTFNEYQTRVAYYQDTIADHLSAGS